MEKSKHLNPRFSLPLESISEFYDLKIPSRRRIHILDNGQAFDDYRIKPVLTRTKRSPRNCNSSIGFHSNANSMGIIISNRRPRSRVRPSRSIYMERALRRINDR